MKIAIPDDYQNVVHTLACYSRLADHEVDRYREPAADLSDSARRLYAAEAIVPVRERSRFPRELIERLPNLRVISQTGRSTRHIDVAACTEHGVLVTAGTHASPIAPAEMTFALVEEGALVDALRAGRPGFAAVDVYEREPVVAGDHPLLAMANVLCPHHVAWAEHDTFELYFGEAFDNLLAYDRGEPHNVINPEVLARIR
jgi:phosphoglycerate dehydrogenase-like enzyme